MKQKTNKLCRFSILALLAAAVGIILYPAFMDQLSGIKQTAVIGTYSRGSEELSEEERKDMMNAARLYNEIIYRNQQESYFRYEGEDYDDEYYDGLLKTAASGNYMAYIEVPKAGIYLPVSYGTKSSELQYCAGHMHGTSVPVGGADTHSVIAAHTGLNNAQLFTGLVKMDIGDAVYIHVLGEIHEYRVCGIYTVLPEEEDGYLQVEAGRDILTLYTCTPYGINDHRLLVRCERTLPDPEIKSSEAESGRISFKNKEAVREAVKIAAIPSSMLLLGIHMAVNKRKDRKNP